MPNQATTDRKDQNGGGDVTKSETVEVPKAPPMVVDVLNAHGPSRFTEEET
jgi:hypothetical protein